MRKEKLTYTQPDCELLVVQFEGVVCESPKNGTENSNVTELGWLD